jgi:predicted nucleic acid-binding protein
MSTALRFLDTNVLLYSISRNPAEHSKRRIAEALLDFDDNALSVQVLQEFYVQATRSTRADALPHDIAAGLVRAWLRFKVQDITHAIMLSALDIKTTHGLSYWDAAIVAAANAMGCRELLSEDMTPRPRNGWRDCRQSVPLKRVG